MSKSELFKSAHKLARGVVAIVGDYMIAFSYALKEIYKNMSEKTFTLLSSVNCGGSNHTFKFEHATQAIVDTLNTRARVWFDDEDGRLDISCTNKHEVADVEIWYSKTTAQPKIIEASNKPRPTRYIELLSVAEEKNLNHGKAWRATAMNVDENSLLPYWEDEFICYVYNN